MPKANEAPSLETRNVLRKKAKKSGTCDEKVDSYLIFDLCVLIWFDGSVSKKFRFAVQTRYHGPEIDVSWYGRPNGPTPSGEAKGADVGLVENKKRSELAVAVT